MANKRYTTEWWVDRFKAEGNYAEDTVFSPTENHPFWLVTCPICSNDEFTKVGLCTGTFVARQSDIIKGKKSCRCCPTKPYTKEQREYQIRKLGKDEGFTFISWEGDFIGNKSRFKWVCREGHLCTSEVKPFLNLGVRCKTCKAIKARTHRKHKWVGKVRYTEGGYKQTIIREQGKYDLFYLCEKCHRDMELFPTLFKVCKGGWAQGVNACGCGRQVRWSKQQYEILCKRASETLGKVFVGFYGAWRHAHTKVVQLCCDHGLWASTTIDKLISGEPSNCPECAIAGYKRTIPANFYLTEWKGGGNRLFKLGITNKKVKRRLSNQKGKTKLTPVVLHTFNHEDGGVVADVEKHLKSEYKMYRNVPKDLLPDGYTEAFFYNEDILNEIVEYCQEHLNLGEHS